jgi:hypothetical protein
MGHVHVHRAGLTMAGVLVGWHAIWAGLSAFGLSQSAYDFVRRIHFLQPEAAMAPFDALNAGLLLLVAAAVGYVTGASLAAVWNCLTAMAESAATRRHGAPDLGHTGRPARG